MRFIPLAEGCGVNLHDSALGEGVCADEFVVGRVEVDADDADFARDAFAGPAEVAAVEAQRAELSVAAAGADEMDAFVPDARVGWLAALLESSVCVREVRLSEGFFFWGGELSVYGKYLFLR